MRILLIAPTVQYNHHYPAWTPFVLFPTGFAYVAAALKQAGHEVYGLNPNNDANYISVHAMIRNKITRAIDNAKPDLIGLGGLCTDYAFIRDAIGIIRKLMPVSLRSKIVLGGGIVTNDSEWIMNQLHPDFCVIGEGEEPVLKLVNDTSPSQIPNIGYWQNGKAVFTQQNFNYQDINRIPFPDYDLFRQSNDHTLTARWIYRYTRPYPKPYVIITARSCPFTCTFCVHGRRQIKYRSRSIENIMQEIKQAYDHYQFNILTILDELFAADKTKLREFCLAIAQGKKQYGWDFDWSFGTHASANLDFDTLELAKSTGCFFYSYGIESMSPAVLASMGKKIKPEQIAYAAKMAEQSRLMFGGNLIFGDPAETEETVAESLDFMVKNLRDTNLCVNAIRPYPGSKLFDLCLERGLIKDKLDYYEHIDQRPWDMTSNMTAMPSKKWISVLDSIVAFGQLYPWVKPAKAMFCNVESDNRTYQVWAKCPHCHQPSFYRELLSLQKSKTTGKSGKVSLNDLKLLKDAAVKAFRLIRMYYFSFDSRIYRLLKQSQKGRSSNVLWKSFVSETFFITGCTHCHKVIKVTIPVPFTLSSFSIGEVKRRLRLVE